MIKIKRDFFVFIICGFILCMSSCDSHPSSAGPDSADEYTSSAQVGEYASEYTDGLDVEKFKDNKVISEWINLCAERERDDIGNYALKYTEDSDGYTIYKYLIYRTVTENNSYSQIKFSDSGKFLNVEIVFNTKRDCESTLTFVKFKAPSDKKVMTDIVCGDDYPGYISTSTEYDIEDAVRAD